MHFNVINVLFTASFEPVEALCRRPIILVACSCFRRLHGRKISCSPKQLLRICSSKDACVSKPVDRFCSLFRVSFRFLCASSNALWSNNHSSAALVNGTASHTKSRPNARKHCHQRSGVDDVAVEQQWRTSATKWRRGRCSRHRCCGRWHRGYWCSAIGGHRWLVEEAEVVAWETKSEEAATAIGGFRELIALNDDSICLILKPKLLPLVMSITVRPLCREADKNVSEISCCSPDRPRIKFGRVLFKGP